MFKSFQKSKFCSNLQEVDKNFDISECFLCENHIKKISIWVLICNIRMNAFGVKCKI